MAKKPTTPKATPKEAPSLEDYKESVKSDKAVQDAKVQQLGEKPIKEIEPTTENKKVVKEDEQLKKDVSSGEKTVIGDIPAYNQTLVQQPLVKDYLSDRPVYPTNEAAMLGLAAQGKLATEAPSGKRIDIGKLAD